MASNERVSQLLGLLATDLQSDDVFLVTDTSQKESKKLELGQLLLFIESSGSFFAFNSAHAETASYILATGIDGNVAVATNASQSISSSFASFALSSSNSITSSWSAFAVTMSTVNADTASFLKYTGGFNGTASFAVKTALADVSSQSFSLFFNGTPNGTASWAVSSSNALSVSTASYALSASSALTASVAISARSADTASSFNGPRFGPTFITPITFRTGSAAFGFTSFDTTPYVPVGTQVVILDAVATNGNTNIPAFIYIRKDTLSPSLILISYESGGGGDVCSYGGQGCFPVASDLTFQYSATAASDGGITIRLVGYF